MRHGSLFSGVGGMDVGMEQAGFDTAFQVEIDDHCNKVLAKHWPDVPRWGDITTVNGADLPPADVISFGSPCQDFSELGKRAGMAGAKSGLFVEAIRIIKEMRHATNGESPRWVIWENVAGALSSAKGDDFAQVLDDLADAGALVIDWAVLDARWVGVPQRRRRVFVVSCFDPDAAEQCPSPLLPVSARSLRDHPKSGPQRKSDSSAPPAGAAEGDRRGGDTSDGGSSEVTDVVAFSENQEARVVLSDYMHYLAGTGGKPGQGYPAVMITETITETITEPVATPQVVDPQIVAAFDSTWSGRYPIPTETGSSPTLKVGSTLGIASPPAVSFTNLVVRRLMPIECERLMGWPDDHTRWDAAGAEQPDTQRYKQCGNGITAVHGRFVGKQILAVEADLKK